MLSHWSLQYGRLRGRGAMSACAGRGAEATYPSARTGLPQMRQTSSYMRTMLRVRTEDGWGRAGGQYTRDDWRRRRGLYKKHRTSVKRP